MQHAVIYNFLGIEGFRLNWYSLFIISGVLGGVVMALIRMQQKQYHWELLVDVLLFVLPLAFVGTRLFYVVFHWESYQGNLYKILAVWEGGLALYGGFIGGLLGAILFSIVKHYPLWRVVDLLIPCMLVGQIIGRWGNFVNQEAYGQLITNPKLCFFPYGVYIDAQGAWYQATFFYESLWNLFVLIAILLLEKKFKEEGSTFAMYLIGYGAGRFWIEGLRSDSLYLTGQIRISQLLSLIGILTGSAMLWWLTKHKKSAKTD